MSDVSEYDLMFGRQTFHSGACARDQQQPGTLYKRPIGRVIIGTVRFNKDGEVVEDSPAQQSLEFDLETGGMKVNLNNT
jgi:hypothetical protein